MKLRFSLLIGSIFTMSDMTIGFTSNFTRVSEADALTGQEEFLIPLLIMSPITSEISYSVPVRVQETRNATIIAADEVGLIRSFDAAFGFRREGVIQRLTSLISGQMHITLLPTINDDFNPEDNNKCFTLQIDKPDVGGVRAIFECDAVVDGTRYYCFHTICINDDDGE